MYFMRVSFHVCFSEDFVTFEALLGGHGSGGWHRVVALYVVVYALCAPGVHIRGGGALANLSACCVEGWLVNGSVSGVYIVCCTLLCFLLTVCM